MRDWFKDVTESFFGDRFKKKSTIVLYMRSGHKIEIDQVVDWEIKYRGNDVTELRCVQYKPKRRFIMGALNLSQIEAMEAL